MNRIKILNFAAAPGPPVGPRDSLKNAGAPPPTRKNPGEASSLIWPFKSPYFVCYEIRDANSCRYGNLVVIDP